jgi:putative restriction endonuclease
MHVVPSSEAYADGLASIRAHISDMQMRLLKAQYFAPERKATATELAKLAQVEVGYPVVNSQYGRLGRKFCEETGFDPDVRPDGTFRWWAVWSLGYNVSGRGFVWEMLPEVAEALETLGWVAPLGFDMPEEVPETDTYIEGAVCKVTINAYERNPEARIRCIERYGANSCVCGICFGAVYGVAAEGLIHVHHVRPLSEVGGEYIIDPIKDLRPVCPNCHAVIHRRVPPYSVEEVKSFLRTI